MLNSPELVSSTLAGKVVFLNAWKFRCPVCVKEMPDLEAIYKKYKDKGVEILGFSECAPLGKTEVDLPGCTARSKEFSYPIGVIGDPNADAFVKSKGVGTQYVDGGLAWLCPGKDPKDLIKTVILGRDGKVRACMGLGEYAAFEEELKKVL